MTLPLIFQALSTDWLGLLGGGSQDVFMKIWDYWYLTSGAAAREGGPFGRTTLLFHPTGGDMSFHSLSLVHVSLSWIFAQLAGWVSGFNLTAIFSLGLGAWTTYLLLVELTGNELAAFLGGLILGFSPWTLSHLTRHPEQMTLFGMPLVFLALLRVTRSGSLRWAVFGGLALAIVGYSGLYLLGITCLSVLGAIAVLGLSRGRWRRPRFWLALLVFGVTSAVCLVPRIWPILDSFATLEEVSRAKYASGVSNDLAALFAPCRNPLLGTVLCDRSRFGHVDAAMYIGLVPLGLTVAAVASRGRHRLPSFGWLALAGFFLLLSAGDRLVLRGMVLESVPMPRPWLTEWIPIPFRAFRAPGLFFPGVLLPLAIVSAVGAARLLESIEQRRPRWLAFGLIAVLLLGEQAVAPFEPIELSVSPFYQQIAKEPEPFAVIELPMGRTPSKRYMLYQTVHGRPMVEGVLGRVPAAAYATIRANALLARWELASRASGRPPSCESDDAERLREAARRLSVLGFRYVILHPQGGRALEADFAARRPLFEDPQVRAYRVEEFVSAPPCFGDARAVNTVVGGS